MKTYILFLIFFILSSNSICNVNPKTNEITNGENPNERALGCKEGSYDTDHDGAVDFSLTCNGPIREMKIYYISGAGRSTVKK